MSQPESSMHDALSEAYDAGSVEESADETVEESSTAAVETEETSTSTETSIETNDDTLVETQSDDGVSTGDAVGDNTETAKGLLNAPASWGVAEREGWSSLSPELQAQIDKREKEIGHSLTTTGEARRFHEEFNTTVDPFKHFIQAEGATPIQAVGNLLQTAATLQGGSQQQKAQRIAELIGHYGIDIQTLDSLLAGEQPQNSPQAQLGEMLDQRLQPVTQFMQQQQFAQQQQYQQQQESVSTELGSFMDNHEFASDVRNEMGDLMEMAGNRGEACSLDQAYERALLLRPDIQAVINQRKAGAAAADMNRQVRQKESAAVSVAGGAAPMGGEKAPTTMRQQLIAAMER